jgi:hypothetical protein
MQQPKYDAFLSHNRLDRDTVRYVADHLRKGYKLKIWIDRWVMRPGRPWSAKIEEGLQSSSSCIIFLGSNGWGPTHLREAKEAVARARVDPSFLVLFVFLGEATEEQKNFITHWYPEFNGIHYEELKTRHDGDLFFNLACAIKRDDILQEGSTQLTATDINNDALRWVGSGRSDHSLLYRGQVLREARDIQRQENPGLTDHANQFLAEGEHVQKKSERNRTITLSTVSAIIGILAIAATFFGIQQRIQRQEAERQTRISDARALAANAETQIQEDPERGVLLAMEAVSTTLRYDEPLVSQAEDVLHQTLQASQIRRTLYGHNDLILGVNLSPDGKRFVIPIRYRDRAFKASMIKG